MKNNNFNFKKLFGAAMLFFSLAIAGNVQAQCQASFTHTVGANGKVFFTSTSTIPGSPKFYSWNFGDGNSTPTKNPTHTYSSAGIYIVSHYSGDSTGCYDVFMDSVYITNPGPCTAAVSFNMSKDSIMPLTWNGYAFYPPNVSSVSWSWGDGSTSTNLYPSHTYSASGTYSICLSMTVSCGATAMYCTTPYIYRLNESAEMLTVSILNPGGPTGIKETKSSIARASIAPNPASGLTNLNIHSETTETYHLSLYSVTGKLVLSETLNTQPGTITKELDVSSLESGLYFLSLSNGTDHRTLRVVKE